MQTLQIGDKLNNILRNEQINPENALREFALINLLNKKEKYLLEIKKFENKYKSNFSDFEKLIHSRKDEENFEIEDDLMDWEFAIECIKSLDEDLKKIEI